MELLRGSQTRSAAEEKEPLAADLSGDEPLPLEGSAQEPRMFMETKASATAEAKQPVAIVRTTLGDQIPDFGATDVAVIANDEADMRRKQLVVEDQKKQILDTEGRARRLLKLIRLNKRILLRNLASVERSRRKLISDLSRYQGHLRAVSARLPVVGFTDTNYLAYAQARPTILLKTGDKVKSGRKKLSKN